MEPQDIGALAARIARLEDIEAIRRLKFHYAWFVDHKMWEELKGLMADGMVFVGTGHELAKDQFVAIVAQSLANLVTSHQLHQSLIDITSATTAKAVWCLRDDLINSQRGSRFKGRAYYTEDYVKVGGEWKFRKVVLEYVATEGAAAVAGADTAMLGLVM